MNIKILPMLNPPDKWHEPKEYRELDPMNNREFDLIQAAVKVDYLQRHIVLLSEHLRSYSHYDMVLLTTTERLTTELNEILEQYLPEDLDNEL